MELASVYKHLKRRLQFFLKYLNTSKMLLFDRDAATANVSQEKAVGMFSSQWILTTSRHNAASQLVALPRERHTNLRMLQVHFVAARVTILSFILNIPVACLFPPPLYSRRCHDVTRRETRRVGVSEYSAGPQPCYNGTSQDTSWYTTLPPPPPPLSEKQEVSIPVVKINSSPTFSKNPDLV